MHIEKLRIVINQTFNGLFEKHIESGADISVVYQKIDANEHPEIVDTYFFTDDNENITAVETGENISGSTKKQLVPNFFVIYPTASSLTILTLC